MKHRRLTADERQSALELLPEVALLEQCRQITEQAIDEAGRLMLMAILQASAEQLTGPQSGGRAKPAGHLRHGSQPGSVYLGASKVRIERPRVRTRDGKEAKILAYETLRTDEAACAKVHHAVVSGLSSRKYKAAVETSLEAVGLSKSGVSRKFVKESARKLKELNERPVPADLVAVLLDGLETGGCSTIIAVGIDASGGKHALGLVEGTTENKAVAADLLRSLIERGLDPNVRRLFVVDGAKALKAAIREIFGTDQPIQRCRVHKKRNVLERLPKTKQAYVKSAMNAAWKLPEVQGVAKMKELAAELRVNHPDAANSLLEGLEETFTVNTLGLPPLLVLSLATTNLIENPNGAIRQAIRRTKRFNGADHAKRWVASVLLEAELNFRTLKGFKDLWILQAALGHPLEREEVV